MDNDVINQSLAQIAEPVRDYTRGEILSELVSLARQVMAGCRKLGLTALEDQQRAIARELADMSAAEARAEFAALREH